MIAMCMICVLGYNEVFLLRSRSTFLSINTFRQLSTSILFSSTTSFFLLASSSQVIAYGVCDLKGVPYLKLTDYMKAAVGVELSATLVIGTIGWLMVHVIHSDNSTSWWMKVFGLRRFLTPARPARFGSVPTDWPTDLAWLLFKSPDFNGSIV